MNENPQPINFHEELLKKLQPRLYGYILSLTASPANARDVLQDSNQVILNKIDTFQPNSNFDAWAFKIAYYQSLSFLQKRSRSKITFNDALLQTIADESQQIDSGIESRIAQLEACIKRLQDRTRAIVCDYYFHNLSIKEISSNRELKTNHIAQVLHRARKALFNCITEMETKTHG